MPPENTNSRSGDIREYRKACETGFWRNVFRAETDCLQRQLQGCQTVLSAGCGPAIIEAALSKLLGVKGTSVFESHEPASAALFVINGMRKELSL